MRTGAMLKTQCTAPDRRDAALGKPKCTLFDVASIGESGLKD